MSCRLALPHSASVPGWDCAKGVPPPVSCFSQRRGGVSAGERLLLPARWRNHPGAWGRLTPRVAGASSLRCRALCKLGVGGAPFIHWLLCPQPLPHHGSLQMHPEGSHLLRCPGGNRGLQEPARFAHSWTGARLHRRWASPPPPQCQPRHGIPQYRAWPHLFASNS